MQPNSSSSFNFPPPKLYPNALNQVDYHTLKTRGIPGEVSHSMITVTLFALIAILSLGYIILSFAVTNSTVAFKFKQTG